MAWCARALVGLSEDAIRTLSGVGNGVGWLLRATKLTGDVNVPAGQISWEAHVPASLQPEACHFANDESIWRERAYSQHAGTSMGEGAEQHLGKDGAMAVLDGLVR